MLYNELFILALVVGLGWLAGVIAFFRSFLRSSTSSSSASSDEIQKLWAAIRDLQQKSPSPLPLPSRERVEVKKPAEPGINWETLLGTRGLLWLGLFILILGAVFFLKYAFDHQWLSEPVRVALGLLAGLSLMVGGRFWLGKYPVWAQSLQGGGLTLLYLSLTVAYRLYHLLSLQTTFWFLCLVTVGGVLFAALTDGWILALLSTLGGFLTPILVSSGQDQALILMTYLAVLDLGVLGIFLWKKWRSIVWLAFSATWFLMAGWMFDYYSPGYLWLVIKFLALYFVIFEGITTGAALLKKISYGTSELALTFLNAVSFGVVSYLLLTEPFWGDQWKEVIAAGALALAGYYALIGITSLKKTANPLLNTFAPLLSLMFVSAGIPVYFSQHWITIAWSLQAAAIFWMTTKISNRFLLNLGLLLLGFLVTRLLLWDAHLPWEVSTLIFNKRGFSFFFVLGALGYFTWLIKEKKIPGFVFLVLVGWWASLETLHYFNHKVWLLGDQPYVAKQNILFAKQISLSIVWAVYSLLILTIGFIKRLAFLRWFALGGLGLTVAKVLLFDTTQLDLLFRMILFLILGILLLLSAFAYTRRSAKKEIQK